MKHPYLIHKEHKEHAQVPLFYMSLCFSLQDAFTAFGEYTDLEWRANTDQIIFKLVALIWTLKDGDPKIRDYTTSTFFNPVLGNVKNGKKQNKNKET